MKHQLSQRELAVLTLATKGYTDDMIANALSIERGTVNSYWVRIRGKLGHKNRSELVARFIQGLADKAHSAEITGLRNSAALEAVQASELLKEANNEIDRLRALLAERDRRREPIAE